MTLVKIQYHAPDGDPCSKCGEPWAVHRQRPLQARKGRYKYDHASIGDPCASCGEPAGMHKFAKYHRPDGDPCKRCGYPADIHRGYKRTREEDHNQVFLGIDGEGQGKAHHKYIFLAAANEEGTRRWSIENDKGLSTVECLDWILELPSYHTRIASFGWRYDWTKIITDLPDKDIYRLMRPELRKRAKIEEHKGPYPVIWGDYVLNLHGSKFTVRRKGTTNRARIIWDVFKFFGTKFVNALKDWKVGTPEMLEFMSTMKDQRGDFDQLSFDQVKEYCFTECRYMAELFHKLWDAHIEAGLRLKSFHGAGSSASAMLDKLKIQEEIKQPIPEMTIPVASAFYGGRFENSVIGPIRKRVYNFDISSAYPYQQCFLPCLKHGKWRRTKKREEIEHAQAALVRYRLPNSGINPKMNWGPFPYRDRHGNICFPLSSGGGWVWRDEYLAGEKYWPNVGFREAWLLESKCDCKPFAPIPHYYRERIRIGKNGPGLVMKLAMNSCYGKLVQSVGSGKFQCWIWGSMITSGCRAQILEMMGQHENMANVLMIATDGIYTLEDVTPPLPRDTDTWETGKPLGGWEREIYEQGVFVARPGVYFPMNPTKDELKSIRGRGVGKGVILENWQTIVDTWEANSDAIVASWGTDEPITVPIANVSRFCGAKTSIHRSGKHPNYTYKRAWGEPPLPGIDKQRSPSYGEWITRKVDMSFNPMPKRSGLNKDGVSLTPRHMPLSIPSMPYSKATAVNLQKIFRLLHAQIEEQPDIDVAHYDEVASGSHELV